MSAIKSKYMDSKNQKEEDDLNNSSDFVSDSEMESDDSIDRNLNSSTKAQRQAEIFEAIKKLDSKNE